MKEVKLHIREYEPSDFEEVEKLWTETGMGGAERGDDAEAIANTVNLGGKLFILENEYSSEIIGTSWLTFDGRRIYLHHFGIKPEYQGYGYSKLLLEESLEWARNKGKQIKLEVHRDNRVAVKLYKKAGFKYLGDYEVYIIRNYKEL
jgi:ribosomal protein S18 acetylase RimI-like enzyme